MSGGFYDYKQYHINDIADATEQLIKNNDSTDNSYCYSTETIKEFKNGLYYLQKASIYVQRIDWLVSGDDSEESFHKHLKEELDDYHYKNQVDSEGRGPKFVKGDRVYFLPRKEVVTVIRQILHYDMDEMFWGNIEILFDDGVSGTCNAWQVRELAYESKRTD